ncbi:MAG: hypothetical protein RIR65_1295 [Planctomycetota bacterium]
MAVHSPTRLVLPTSIVFLGCALGACGSGDAPGAPATPASGPSQLQLALVATPEPGLLAVDARVVSLRLVGADGGLGAELLDAPVHIDLQRTAHGGAWLASRSVQSGDYAGVRLELDGVQPRGLDGVAQPIDAAQAVVELDFPTTARWHAGAGRRCIATLDLAAALFDGGSGSWSFAPQGTASADGAVYGEPLRALRGTVVGFDAANGSLRVLAQVDEDGNAALGRVDVDVDAATLLVDAENESVPRLETFVAGLQAGSSVLEVRGCLANGRLAAERIELVSTNGAPHHTLVKLDGLVAQWNPLADGFELRVASVQRGRALVAPAGELPQAVSFMLDASTEFALVDGQPSTRAEFEARCADGARVTVRCAAWNPAGPQVATKLELDDPHDVYGASILDAEGAPSLLLVQLDPSEEAVVDGATDAEVELALVDDQLVLDLGQGAQATLPAADLQAGQRLYVTATLPAKGSSLVATAERVVVVAGRREGVLVASAAPGADAVLHSLSMAGDLPFGDAVDAASGPKPVRFVADCIVRGDLDTRAALLSTIGNWPNLRARVRGVASADGAILVHAVEVDL